MQPLSCIIEKRDGICNLEVASFSAANCSQSCAEIANKPVGKAKRHRPNLCLDCAKSDLDFVEAHAATLGTALVLEDLAVADGDHAMRVLGDVVLVSDEDDGVAFLV